MARWALASRDGDLMGGDFPGWLAELFGPATFLPLAMDIPRGTTVFVMIFSMCAIAGLLAMRKLRDANPADMF